jgi:hypothetical protein
MRKQLFKIVLGLLLTSTVITSCKKDKDEEPNDSEVITTMQLTFVPNGGGTTLTYQFDDADGPGGAAPTVQDIVLAPSKTYAVTVKLLDKTKTPVADITEEVEEEADAHRFYYEPTATSNVTVSGLNNDANAIPLGVTSTWTTGAVATGKTKVTLRHYPGTPPNKALGDLVSSSKSDTDIEVEFNTRIQ